MPVLSNLDYAYCSTSSLIPENGVPHVNDIPHNTTLVAFSPYVSDECANMLIDQAFKDGASLIIFANDTLLSQARSNHKAMVGNSPVSVLAVATQTGQNAFAQMALYQSNQTVSVPGTDISNTIQRVGIQVQSQLTSSLPRLWVFVLAVIAGVLAVIVMISLILNCVLYMRRRNLRRRILNGQVNLELLGVKRMTVPQEVLDKIPIRIYTHGEQHFHNDESSGGGSTPVFSSNGFNVSGWTTSGKGSWKDRLKPHQARTKSDAVANAAGASGVGPSRKEIGSGYSQTSCPICLEDFEDNVTPVRELACDHIYHMDCIDNFLKTRSSLCPLCKKSTLPTGYIPASLRLTNATVRREREMRRRAVHDTESTVTEVATSVAGDESTIGEHRSSLEPARASDNPVNLAAPVQQEQHPNLEALAVSEEEEAAEQRRRPGWRRVLHRIFPF